jgi:hypothetical protein
VSPALENGRSDGHSLLSFHGLANRHRPLWVVQAWNAGTGFSVEAEGEYGEVVVSLGSKNAIRIIRADEAMPARSCLKVPFCRHSPVTL